jgi:hypothetical protein
MSWTVITPTITATQPTWVFATEAEATFMVSGLIERGALQQDTVPTEGSDTVTHTIINGRTVPIDEVGTPQ